MEIVRSLFSKKKMPHDLSIKSSEIRQILILSPHKYAVLHCVSILTIGVAIGNDKNKAFHPT